MNNVELAALPPRALLYRLKQQVDAALAITPPVRDHRLDEWRGGWLMDLGDFRISARFFKPEVYEDYKHKTAGR